MRISTKAWLDYIRKMSAISEEAANKMQRWIQQNGFGDDQALLEYAFALSSHYGEAIGALACEMYEKTAEAQGVTIAPAEIADTPEFGEVAKAVHGTMNESLNKVPATVGRLVKRTGADTTLKNAIRDGAEFAWVPYGDTCAFCIALASRGWQTASKQSLKNGHAEHIHSHCDCQYAIRFDGKSGVKGYEPQKYLRMYYGADPNGSTKDKINALRRQLYQENILLSELGTFKKRIIADENIQKEYYNVLKKRFSHASEISKKIFNKYVPDDSVADYNYTDIARFDKYNTKKIYLSSYEDVSNTRGPGASWFHEHGHLIDDALGTISDDPVFYATLHQDMKDCIERYAKEYSLNDRKAVEEKIGMDLQEYRKHSGVSDILHGLSDGNIKGNGAHPLAYWEKSGNITSEAFAHMFECQSDKIRYNEMKLFFPKALQYFENRLKEAI